MWRGWEKEGEMWCHRVYPPSSGASILSGVTDKMGDSLVISCNNRKNAGPTLRLVTLLEVKVWKPVIYSAWNSVYWTFLSTYLHASSYHPKYIKQSICSQALLYSHIFSNLLEILTWKIYSWYICKYNILWTWRERLSERWEWYPGIACYKTSPRRMRTEHHWWSPTAHNSSQFKLLSGTYNPCWKVTVRLHRSLGSNLFCLQFLPANLK